MKKHSSKKMSPGNAGGYLLEKGRSQNKRSVIVKQIEIECQCCGYSDNAPDSDKRFDEIIEMEKCPKCGGECNCKEMKQGTWFCPTHGHIHRPYACPGCGKAGSNGRFCEECKNAM